jgi:hypothetical protein
VNALCHRLKPLSGIALVAVLALVLPTLSHALAFMQVQRAPWSEVCSAQRSPRVVTGEEGGAPLAAHAAIEHCVWCGLSGVDLVPLPDVACAPRAAGPGRPPVMASSTDAAQRRVWAPAQTRAPPSRA